MSSRYDELYDKYSDVTASKKGTKYERLVAFVFKLLRRKTVVIHDIKLMGTSDVKHQIDVTVESNGRSERTLIECKDFDISNKPVGLGVIRDFWAVVDDTKPDNAIVITCNRFTRNAKKFAKAKGIKLAVLRQFQERDWEGRIKTIAINLHLMCISEPHPSIHLSDPAYLKKLQEDLSSIGSIGFGIWKNQPVFIHLEGNKTQINEFIERQANSYPRDKEGPVKLTFSNLAIEVADKGPVPIEGFTIEFGVFHSNEFFEVTSSKVAELIVEGMGAEDIIIFGEDIKRLDIDPESGEIIERT